MQGQQDEGGARGAKARSTQWALLPITSGFVGQLEAGEVSQVCIATVFTQGLRLGRGC